MTNSSGSALPNNVDPTWSPNLRDFRGHEHEDTTVFPEDMYAALLRSHCTVGIDSKTRMRLLRLAYYIKKDPSSVRKTERDRLLRLMRRLVKAGSICGFPPKIAPAKYKLVDTREMRLKYGHRDYFSKRERPKLWVRNKKPDPENYDAQHVPIMRHRRYKGNVNMNQRVIVPQRILQRHMPRNRAGNIEYENMLKNLGVHNTMIGNSLSGIAWNRVGPATPRAYNHMMNGSGGYSGETTETNENRSPTSGELAWKAEHLRETKAATAEAHQRNLAKAAAVHAAKTEEAHQRQLAKAAALHAAKARSDAQARRKKAGTTLVQMRTRNAIKAAAKATAKAAAKAAAKAKAKAKAKAADPSRQMMTRAAKRAGPALAPQITWHEKGDMGYLVAVKNVVSTFNKGACKGSTRNGKLILHPRLEKYRDFVNHGLDIKYIADLLKLEMKKDQTGLKKPTKKYKPTSKIIVLAEYVNKYAFAILETKIHPTNRGSYKIDVICGESGASSKPLIEYIIARARRDNCDVHLEAVPRVVDYYPRFGFKPKSTPTNPAWRFARDGWPFRKHTVTGSPDWHDDAHSVPESYKLTNAQLNKHMRFLTPVPDTVRVQSPPSVTRSQALSKKLFHTRKTRSMK